ncbi:MAG: LytTR family DNA-binding domain-containing protein [Bacteroidales bacterium]|nr:LytTR family DNA-binding domain-containing protein [Bacteroidales bacterium]MCF8455021.1 LytTR family DNA-binding domain-containing protein [Bacteroidales bacterium]
MKVIIVEDEKPAAEKLERLLTKYDSAIEIMGIFSSVSQTVEWLRDPANHVDLLFLDIQLSDGLSFDIFTQINIQKPIIFTTAFNEYAIEAFKLNSIDYLLKPIRFDDLHWSMEKIKSLQANLPDTKQKQQFEELSLVLSQFQKSYKTRFMVKVGDHIRTIATENISLFYADGRTVYLVTDAKKQYIIDYRLEQLEEILDPSVFFRVNRTFIVQINSIADVLVYSNSRLKIKLLFDFDKEIIVSREKVSQLKIWFNGFDGN